MRSREGWRPPVLVVGALALVLTACSSGGSAKSATVSTAEPVTTTTTPSANAAKPSDGCTNSSPAHPGQERVNVTSGGVVRWYLRHIPPSYAPRAPMPVVIDLHGYMEGATIQTAASGLGAYGDAHGFVTITPEGSGDGRFVTWNTTLGSADVKFVADLLDQFEHSLCVDERRIFVTGYSQGAFMTSTLACEFASRIAAVATVAGIRNPPGCNPARAVPVVAFHGTADPDIAYTGGLGPSGLNLPAYDGSGKTMAEEGLEDRPPLNGAAIPAITTAWAERNGCATDSSASVVASDVTRLAWPCPKGGSVVLYRITGGGHTWPGSPFTAAAAALLGPTTMSISADAIIWRFFEAHPLRES